MIFLNENQIKEACDFLKKGEIIAFPTETVYGLAVLSTSKENFDKLVKIKHRHPDKPFTLMISNIEQVKDYVELNDVSKKIINKFTPGELTIIVKSKPNISQYLDLGTGFIGIRIPNSSYVLKLIDTLNEPLLVPSANPSDLPPAKNSKEVYDYFKDGLAAIVEGETKSNVPSTVIKVDGDNVILLRQGNIKLDDILKEINK